MLYHHSELVVDAKNNLRVRFSLMVLKPKRQVIHQPALDSFQSGCLSKGESAMLFGDPSELTVLFEIKPTTHLLSLGYLADDRTVNLLNRLDLLNQPLEIVQRESKHFTRTSPKKFCGVIPPLPPRGQGETSSPSPPAGRAGEGDFTQHN